MFKKLSDGDWMAVKAIFFLGCIYGIVDNKSFDIGYCIGGGIGILLVSIAIGTLIYYMLGVLKINRIHDVNSATLDSDLITANSDNQQEIIKEKFTLFQISLGISIIIFVLLCIEKISKF